MFRYVYEWFLVKIVSHGISENNQEWRCDQFDGLVKFLKDKLNRF